MSTEPTPALGPPEAEEDLRPRWTPGGIALQAGGVAVCLALLYWCLKSVFAPENREQLAKLKDASTADVLMLFGLGVATTILGGEMFRQTLRPVRLLPVLDAHAVNFIANLLAPLARIGTIVRIALHNRRDRIPLLTIAAWFAALAAISVLCTIPPVVAGLWRGALDGMWWVTSLGGIAVISAAMVVIARGLCDGAGWRWLERLIRSLPLVPVAIKGSADGSNPGLLPRLHECLRMLSHPGSVGICVALRVADMGVHAARILVAASIVGISVPAEKAVIAGSAYFLLGAAAGQAGAREGGTSLLLGRLMPDVNLNQFMLVVLMISASEAAVLLGGSLLGAAWLKPWRILRK